MSADTDQLVVNEYPEDGVAIGESPDGDRLSGAQARELLTTRRKLLIGLGTLGAIAAIAEASLEARDGTFWGGTMALDKAYKIGPRTYLGPDSIKDSVIDDIPDTEGWKYEASDTEVDYWLDDGAWVGPMGVGSSGTKAGASHFQSLTTGEVTTTNKGVWVWHDGKLLDFIAESDHADIGAAFSSAKSTYGLKDIRYVVPAGDYGTVSNTVDLANVGSVNAMVDFSGVRFTFDSDGDPIFDFTNSHNSIVLDLRGAEFDGDSTNVPSCGLLFARPSGGGSAGNHQVYGGTFDGHYSAAPFYNIGGEVMNFYGCQFYNKNASGRAAGFTGAENPDSVTSPSGATATAGSASTNQFWGCSFNGSGPTTSLVIGQGSVFMTSFYRCQINGGTDSFIRFKADGGDINHVGFFMCHGESGSNTPSEVIDSIGPGSGQNAIKGIQFPTANFSGATNFLDLADNLQMVDWKIGTFARAGGFIVPGGVTINDDDSFAVNWSFINLEITGSWSFPNGGSMQNSILFGSLSNLGIDPAHSLVFDLGSDSIWGMSGVNSSVWNFQSKYIAEKDGAKTYLGARTSTPHTASGTGDVYIDVSQNPPKWQIDDPTDSAWEDM